MVKDRDDDKSLFAAHGFAPFAPGIANWLFMGYDDRMIYVVGLKPKASKDLRHLQKQDARRVADALEELADGLSGDVRRLTNFSPEYRLRVGSFRVLFEIENENEIVVYRVVHRREAYR